MSPNLGQRASWLWESINRYRRRLDTLLSKEPKATERLADELCDVWAAASELETWAGSMRRAFEHMHQLSVASDLVEVELTGAQLTLLAGATLHLETWHFEKPGAAALAKATDSTAARRLCHRVSAQHRHVKPWRGQPKAGQVAEWIGARVPLSLTRAELQLAAAACRITALECATSMGDFEVVTAAHIVSGRCTPADLESLGELLDGASRRVAG